MTVPARYRDVLATQCAGRLTLVRHPDGCLVMYPRLVWEQQRERIAAWPANARAWQRILLGSATDVEMDGTGRILVAPELRAAAALSRELMLLGLGNRFEVWDAATLAAREGEALSGPPPDAVASFAF
jgi:MraZ protein